MRLPNFIIAGAPRSGSTWLYKLLDSHPEVELAKPMRPEPKFFHSDDLYEKGIEYYSKTWFENLSKDKIIGEKSTNYLENSRVVKRIYDNIKDVKLIFIFRDPVYRAWSNYKFSFDNGLESEQSFIKALEKEEERESKYDEKFKFIRPFSYFSRGLYAKNLKPFIDVFSRENLLFLRFEDIKEDVDNILNSLKIFLDLNEEFSYVDKDAVNKSVHNYEIKDSEKLFLQERYKKPNEEFYKIVGSEFKKWDY